MLAMIAGLGLLLGTSCSSNRNNVEGSMDAPSDENRAVEVEDRDSDATNSVEYETSVDANDELRVADYEDGWGESREERMERIDRLEDLRDRLDDSMREVDSRMKNTTDQKSLDQLRAYRLELERERARVNDALRNTYVTEGDAWTDMRVTVDRTAEDVGAWFDRQGDRLEQMIQDDDVDGTDDQD